MTLTSHPRPFRVLSLDGGGIRGAFSASLLAEIERRLGGRIAEHFDLIAGTSTGGIIAAALALGEPASRIVDFYHRRGARIFQRPKRDRGLLGRAVRWIENRGLSRVNLDSDWMWSPKYDGRELSAALDEVFGSKTLENVTCRTIIPAVDLTTGQTIVFKSPHLPNMFRDRNFRVADILRATTAAPTYFPHAVFGAGTAYVDGGLWANNPTMVAVAEALRIASACRRPGLDPVFTVNNVQVLSVGTGRTRSFSKPPPDGGGIAWWLPSLFDVASVSQSQGVHFQSNYILDDRYRRIDFDLPNDTWKLDSTEFLDELIHIGSAKAVENFAHLRDTFLNCKAEQFIPFSAIESASDTSCTERRVG